MKTLSEQIRRTYLNQFEEELVEEIAKNGSYKKIEAGGVLMDIGQKISHMPLILSGAIKILQEDEAGDELLLYFIEMGDTCAMTLNCCMGNTVSEIRAIAEVETELILVPIRFMDEWTAKYGSWRRFIFDNYHNRFSEMLQAIDTLVFQNMESRLKKYLKELQGFHKKDRLQITHQEIAYDLHTSRVVVSRLLKKMEKEGSIELHRNSIEVIEL